MSDHVEVLLAMLNEEASRLSLQNYEREAIKAAISSLRQVSEGGDYANISDVLCASFGQYFEAGGIIELDIQDDDQVRPLLAYMAQGVADYFLRDGNKLANLLYSMGDAVQASEWEQVQRELAELRATESAIAALLPGPYYMDPPDGGSVSLVEQLQRMADDARKWREVNPAPPTSGPLRQAPEVVAVIGECAEVQWLNGGPCQLPPGARLFAACAAKRPRKTSSKCTRNCDCVADCKHPDKATPAQALGEVMALVDDFAFIAGKCGVDHANLGHSNNHKADFNQKRIAIEVAIGQHFAGLEAELRDWQNLLTAVIAPRGLPGVSVEYPKLWPFDGGQDAAMVAFALHTAIERAEAAEARCAEAEEMLAWFANNPYAYRIMADKCSEAAAFLAARGERHE